MPIADLHCHPSVKALLGSHPTQSVRAWQDYRFNLKMIVNEIDEHFGDALDSQSSLTQIVKGDGRVIFWIIYPFEKEYVEKYELIQLATKAKGINQKMIEYFLEEDNGRKYVKKNVSYYNILKNEELPLYEATADIKRITPADSSIDKSKLNIALCIEGAHSFLSGRDKPWMANGIRKSDYLKRVNETFKNFPIFYLTLAHIAPNGIFNHAFAGKLLNERERVKFLPRELDPSGITELGFELIDKCIAHNVHPDVKHLSYRGRISLYDYLDEKKRNREPFIAPIASHMGVWGIPESGIKSAFTQGATFISYKYTDPGGRQHILVECTTQARKHKTYDAAFYPRTISLLDDDIVRIARLGGIIGIIIDQRVLGYGRKNRMEDDVMTLSDFKWLCERNNIEPYDYLKGNSDTEVIAKAKRLKEPPRVKWPIRSPNNKVDRTGPPKSTKAKKQLHLFCYNILHVMDVLRKNGINNPWSYVCFGSDYDGLVDAVNCCKTFEDVPEFRERVELFMKGVHSFKRKYGIRPEEFCEQFFYHNTLKFFKIGKYSIRP